MHILLIAQYFKPEEIGAPIWIHQLAVDLVERGHQVTILTAFPNYPKGQIFEGYRGKVFQRETIDGVQVIRTWIYATPSKAFWPRLLNFGSFCLSSLVEGLPTVPKPDVIYAILPPLPLGVTAAVLDKFKGAPFITNIQDIYPRAAVVMGVIKNRGIIRFFEWMERWIYRKSAHIVVISEGFKENLIEKGVPEQKVSVIPNWADSQAIQPGPKKNSFRTELGVESLFTLIYSGGLTENSNVEPVIYAAEILRDDPFAFVIVGEGVQEPRLRQLVESRGLTNVQFKPFQPLERYPQVLCAADMTLVTLSNQATFVSVPSKIFKQMAAGRPIMAITAKNNELARLIQDARCGICVPPDSPEALAEALRYAASTPKELDQMGHSGRLYLERYHSRKLCVQRIESTLQEAVK